MDLVLQPRDDGRVRYFAKNDDGDGLEDDVCNLKIVKPHLRAE